MSAASRTSVGRRTAPPPVDDSKAAAARARLTDTSAIKFFDRFIGEYDEWSVGELEALVLASEARERLDTARAAIKKHGLLVPGQKGNLVRNPAYAVERAASVELRSLLKLLKLSEGE